MYYKDARGGLSKGYTQHAINIWWSSDVVFELCKQTDRETYWTQYFGRVQSNNPLTYITENCRPYYLVQWGECNKRFQSKLGRGCITLFPPKFVTCCRGTVSHIIHGILGLPDLSPQTSSQTSQSFFQNTWSLPVDRQIDRLTEWQWKQACTNSRFTS